MRCNNCGKELPDWVRFCSRCGAQQPQQQRTLREQRRVWQSQQSQQFGQAQQNAPLDKNSYNPQKIIGIAKDYDRDSMEIYASLLECLDSHDFKYIRDDKELMVYLQFAGKGFPKSFIFDVDNSRKFMTAVSIFPFDVKNDKIHEIKLATATVNSVIAVGSFDYWEEQKTVAYRIDQFFAKTSLNNEIFDLILGYLYLVNELYSEKFFMLNQGMINLSQFIDSVNSDKSRN